MDGWVSRELQTPPPLWGLILMDQPAFGIFKDCSQGQDQESGNWWTRPEAGVADLGGGVELASYF